MKAELGDGEEEFDLEEGYIQQQKPPLCQPSQSQEAAPSQDAPVPGSGTTASSSKALGRQTSQCLAGRHLVPQLQQQIDDKDDEEEEEGEEEEGHVCPAVPEAISTTVSTTLTIPGLKHSYNRSQAQHNTKQHSPSNAKQHSPSNAHVIASAARGKRTGAD